MTQSVGYIGLGAIGAPMAERIALAGFDLTVWNRTPDKMQPLIAKGARAAGSAAEVGAATDIVFLCLDSPYAVEAVVFGPLGVAAGGRTKLIVDNSTLHPKVTVEMAQRLRAEHGIGWVDAPVSGGPGGAQAGTLASFAGGTAEEFERARPMIAAYSGTITHMGGQGAGQATKICNQVINFATMMAIAEACSLSQCFGLNSDLLPQALAGGFADSNMLKEYGRANAIAPDHGLARLMNSFAGFMQGRVDPSYAGRLQIGLKDVGIAMDMGREVGSPMMITGVVDNVMRVLHYQKPNGERPPAT
ncbi:NAD(P)-dependent oxidoreductase [Phenylobacterium sp.]|uniref:NAD(P)-dependent oxidoreductase n=1 Tax=Phenylobacterium sp. TaxID=1871053 RepID=UPI002734CCAA|nr:NAD(P)-dependent oxidoreductase [Phenylobacterium sp.]MDP3659242.1 NAD(P)-dependent oxidoreductase [Phenylobacterium sp.]